MPEVDPYEAVANPILQAASKCAPGEDCSAFAQNLQKNRGIKVPRTAVQQYDASQRINYGDLQPGDHVFFDNNQRDAYNTNGKARNGGYINHVGVYSGNGQFIADPGQHSDDRTPQDLAGYLKRTGFKFKGGGRFSNPSGGGVPDDPYESVATKAPELPTDDPYEAAAVNDSKPSWDGTFSGIGKLSRPLEQPSGQWDGTFAGLKELLAKHPKQETFDPFGLSKTPVAPSVAPAVNHNQELSDPGWWQRQMQLHGKAEPLSEDQKAIHETMLDLDQRFGKSPTYQKNREKIRAETQQLKNAPGNAGISMQGAAKLALENHGLKIETLPDFTIDRTKNIPGVDPGVQGPPNPDVSYNQQQHESPFSGLQEAENKNIDKAAKSASDIFHYPAKLAGQIISVLGGSDAQQSGMGEAAETLASFVNPGDQAQFFASVASHPGDVVKGLVDQVKNIYSATHDDGTPITPGERASALIGTVAAVFGLHEGLPRLRDGLSNAIEASRSNRPVEAFYPAINEAIHQGAPKEIVAKALGPEGNKIVSDAQSRTTRWEDHPNTVNPQAPALTPADAVGSAVKAEVATPAEVGSKEPWQITQAEFAKPRIEATAQRNAPKSWVITDLATGKMVETYDNPGQLDPAKYKVQSIGDHLAGLNGQTPEPLDAQGLRDGQLGNINLRHETAVRNALAEGKAVPPEVLKDYPDLAPKETKEESHAPVQEKQIEGSGENVVRSTEGGQAETGGGPRTSKGDKEGLQEPSKQEVTNLSKHEDSTYLRDELGYPEYSKEGRSLNEDLTKAKEYSPEEIQALAESVNKNPRPLKSEEQIALELQGRRLYDQLSKFTEEDMLDPEKQNAHDAIRKSLEQVLDASDKAGSEWGRGGVARRARLRESMDGFDMITQAAKIKARSGLGPLTDAERTQFEQLAEAHKNVVEELAKRDAERVKQNAEQAVEKAKRATKKAENLEDILSRREKAKARIEEIRNRGRKTIGGKRSGAVNRSILEDAVDLVAPVSELVKTYIQEGISKLPDLVEKLRKDLKSEEWDDPTDDEIHRLISGHGIDVPQGTKSELQKTQSELKQQAGLIAKINDAISGTEPPKTPKPVDSDIVAGLRKSLEEVKRVQKSRNPKPNDPSVALTKKIDGLLDILEEGRDPLDKPKPTPVVTPEVAELRKKAAALEKFVNDKHGGKAPQKIQNQINAIKSKIEAAKGQLEGNYRNLKPKSVTPDAVKKAQAELSNITSQMNLKDKISDLQEQIDTDTFKDTKKPKADKDPKIQKLVEEKTRLETLKNHRLNDLKPKTIQQILHRLQVANLISGASILAKIPVAGALGEAIAGPETVVANMMSHLPGMQGETEGVISPKATLRTIQNYFDPRENGSGWEAFTDKGTKLGRTYGHIQVAKGPLAKLLSVPGRLHETMMYPIQRAAFAASVEKMTQYLSSKGADISSPEVMEFISKKAYTDSLMKVFRNQNALTKPFHNFIHSLEVQHPTAALVIQSLIPILELPTNVAGRMGEYAGGGGYGLGKQVIAKMQGVKLDGAARDAVLRAYKRGGSGAALMALGYYYHDAAAEVRKNKILSHSPVAAAFGWGDVIYHSFNDPGTKTSPNPDMLSRVTDAAGKIGLDALHHVPLVSNVTNLAESINDGVHGNVSTSGKFLADYLAGWLIPFGSAISSATQPLMDANEVKSGDMKYQARGFREKFMTHVPGWRQSLETVKVKKPKE